jgi:RsiW-degrading membrane proteinase PrsW (M82 family)
MEMEGLYAIVIVISSALWMRFLGRRQEKGIRGPEEYPVAAAFLFGGLSVVPTLILYFLHPLSYVYLPEPFYHVLIVGPVEESVKFLTFLFLVRTWHTVKDPRDGMIQAAAVGLGFSAVENFLYAQSWGMVVLLIRSLISTAGHMTYSSFWGFAYGLRLYSAGGPEDGHSGRPFAGREKNFAAVFCIAAFAHGLFNSLAGAGLYGIGLFGALSFQIFLLFVSDRAFGYLSGFSPYRIFSYKKAEEALCVLGPALRRDPDSLILRRRYGLHLLTIGRYEAAEKHFLLCIRKADLKPPYRLLRGAAAMGAGDVPRGRCMVREASAQLSAKQRSAMSRELGKVLRQSELAEGVREAMG